MQKTTTQPISTVFHNSPAFMRKRLDDLVKSGNIVFYAFVWHKAEQDENKDHGHLYVDCNGKVELEEFRKLFIEPDPAKPDLPIKPLPFRVTKSFEDWYLYSIHNKQYLAYKGQEREFHYTYDDVKTNDRDILDSLIAEIDMSKYTAAYDMIQAVLNGADAIDLIVLGKLKPNEYYRYQGLISALRQDMKTHRGNGEKHE